MSDPHSTNQLKGAVREVLEERRDAEAQERATRLARQRREQRQVPLVGFLLLGWGFLAWAWVAKPALIFGQKHAPARSAAYETAKLRHALYLERARIDEFRSREGHLPDALKDAGPVEDGVRYDRTPDGYELTGGSGAGALRLTHAMAADSFLGDAIAVLRQDGQ